MINIPLTVYSSVGNTSHLFLSFFFFQIFDAMSERLSTDLPSDDPTIRKRTTPRKPPSVSSRGSDKDDNVASAKSSKSPSWSPGAPLMLPTSSTATGKRTEKKKGEAKKTKKPSSSAQSKKSETTGTKKRSGSTSAASKKTSDKKSTDAIALTKKPTQAQSSQMESLFGLDVNVENLPPISSLPPIPKKSVAKMSTSGSGVFKQPIPVSDNQPSAIRLIQPKKPIAIKFTTSAADLRAPVGSTDNPEANTSAGLYDNLSTSELDRKIAEMDDPLSSEYVTVDVSTIFNKTTASTESTADADKKSEPDLSESDSDDDTPKLTIQEANSSTEHQAMNDVVDPLAADAAENTSQTAMEVDLTYSEESGSEREEDDVTQRERVPTPFSEKLARTKSIGSACDKEFRKYDFLFLIETNHTIREKKKEKRKKVTRPVAL